jgi:hypothetical protein
MKSRMRNNWRQPPVPLPQQAVSRQIVVENLSDLQTALADKDTASTVRLWSPPGAAGIHGVLWFVSLQQAALEQFPDLRPLITLDCGDRADLAHAALREGLRSLCFRGSIAMLEKLQQIANPLGVVIETQHPSLTS